MYFNPPYDPFQMLAVLCESEPFVGSLSLTHAHTLTDYNWHGCRSSAHDYISKEVSFHTTADKKRPASASTGGHKCDTTVFDVRACVALIKDVF